MVVFTRAERERCDVRYASYPGFRRLENGKATVISSLANLWTTVDRWIIMMIRVVIFGMGVILG